MRITNAAPAAGGGAVDAGFRRFLLVGATNEDPISQTASLTETDDHTEWTSNALPGGLGAGGSNPQNGSVYVRALTDANGDAVTWDKPFTVTCRLERISPITGVGSVKNNLMYWGFGLTDASSSIAAAKMIGQDTRWNSSTHTRHYRFRLDAKDNAQNATLGYDVQFSIVHGPKKNSQAGHTQVVSYVFDPADPTNNAEASMNTYNIGSERITGTGAVYAFVTVGVADAVDPAVSGKFRVWYTVNATDLDWDIS